jgi:hypothetical protein
MFERRKRLFERLADAADLVIDFATLGEYGLEPIEDQAPSCAERRRRSEIRFAPVDRTDHLPARL